MRKRTKLQKIEAIANDPRGEANTRRIAAAKAAKLREEGAKQIIAASETYRRNVFGDGDDDATRQSLALGQLCKDVIDIKRKLVKRRFKGLDTEGRVRLRLFEAIDRIEAFYKIT